MTEKQKIFISKKKIDGKCMESILKISRNFYADVANIRGRGYLLHYLFYKLSANFPFIILLIL
jgi:hypothetical protein